jgi:uncharacterized protein YdaU (DUF1376 family)
LASSFKARRIDFSPDEWLAGTLGLRPEDRGVYITVCALIYSRGGPIGEELVFAHCRAHGNAIRASLNRLETLGKLIRNGLEISQKRCGIELEKAQKRHEKRIENGAKGGRPNGLEKPDGLDDSRAHVTINHQPSTINESTNVDSLAPKRRELESEFEEIWKLFPRKRDKGHALKAFVAARKIAALDVIHEGLLRHCREVRDKEPQFIPYPASWLNGRRWLDDDRPSNGFAHDVSERRTPREPPPPC